MHLDLGAKRPVDTKPGAPFGSIACVPVPGRDYGARSLAEAHQAATGGRAAGVLPPGLVEQVTTHTSTTETPAQILRSLNKTRRLRRMRHAVAAHADATRDSLALGGFRWYAALVTLTYAQLDAYRPEQVTAYLNALRNWCARSCNGSYKIHFEWVMELQERGAPHYHLLIWIPEGRKIPKPDAQGWWTHGMSNIQRARNGVGYLVKYVSKGNNSCFSMPQGARLFGTGGDAPARLARHRAGLPRWLVAQIPLTSRAHREPFAGWVCDETGEVFRSPFGMRWGYDEHGNAVVVVVKRTEGDQQSWRKLDGTESRMALSVG